MSNIRVAYFTGEKPELQTYDFDDSTGAAVDLTGFTAVVRWTNTLGVSATTSATVVNPGTLGRVSFFWPDAMFNVAGGCVAHVVATQTGGDLRIYDGDLYVVTIRQGA